MTDRSDAIDIQRNVEANIALNGIEGVARFLALDWGHMAVSDSLLRIFETVDVLLAADCFYASQGKRFLTAGLSDRVVRTLKLLSMVTMIQISRR